VFFSIFFFSTSHLFTYYNTTYRAYIWQPAKVRLSIIHFKLHTHTHTPKYKIVYYRAHIIPACIRILLPQKISYIYIYYIISCCNLAFQRNSIGWIDFATNLYDVLLTKGETMFWGIVTVV